MKVSYLTRLGDVDGLPREQLGKLDRVTRTFAFRSNSYYNGLIDWDDPDDPIRRLVIPHEDELLDWGRLDASGEADYAVLPGLEHKYPDTALLLLNNVCGAFCRFCFRKRLFIRGNRETSLNIHDGVQYIRAHREIRNVLLTGGDPLMMATARLEGVLTLLAGIRHLRIIRIGSKLTAFNPHRILDDPALVELLARISRCGPKIYLMNHFNHPRELTSEAQRALGMLAEAGVALVNQTPMIRGINDDPAVLRQLFERLTGLGVPPYYVFQCRPTRGNLIYALPLEQAYRTFIEAWRHSSGLARRARLVMSHHSGKIEVTGLTRGHIIFRYHRAPDPANDGKTVICQRNPRGYWFDDFRAVDGLSEPLRHASPDQAVERPADWRA